MKHIVFLLLFFCTGVGAADSTVVKWGTDHWEGFTDYNGTGFYHELINEIFPSPTYAVEVSYFPWKRSLRHLSQADIHMTGAMPKNDKFYQSEKPLLKANIVLVSKTQKDFTELDLKNKIGAYRAGYDDVIFYAVMPSSVSGIAVQNVSQGLSLLKQGKVDFYVDTENLTYQFFGESIQRKELFSKEVGHLQLYWSFAKTDTGERLKRQFDKQMLALEQKGILSELYAKYSLEIPH